MNNNDNSKQNYDDEIDLRQLFKSLKERSRFIVGFTGIVTLIAIGYVLSLTAPPTQYNVETSFLKPSQSSVIRLHQYSLLNDMSLTLLNETTSSVFNRFLITVNSLEFQKKVFIDGGYEEKLGKGAIPSMSITKNQESKLTGVELPHTLTAQSFNPDIVSEFLNEVLTAADKETINYFINTHKLKISNRLNELATERQLLLTKTKQDRVSLIKRIKEEDNQKLREINNMIDAARLLAKKERMNQIVILTNAAKLAATLGITDNNLNLFNSGKNNTNLNIAIQSGTNIPDWYLFGETVLLEMVSSLRARVSDDPYISELAVLDNQINAIKNNTRLQVLEQRLDDIPFVSGISELDIKIIKLESISPDSSGINAMQLYQAATSKIIPTSSRNRLIIVLAFIGSFILSILLVFLMNSFKEEDVTSIQKGK